MRLVNLLDLAAQICVPQHRHGPPDIEIRDERRAVQALNDFLSGSGPGVELDAHELGLLVGLLLRTAGPGALEQRARAEAVAAWATALGRDAENGDLAEALLELRASSK